MKKLALHSFRLKNFKAVKDSGVIKFKPLTVFIGNNGSGKSSIIEGLETFQSVVVHGLDKAMEHWRGFEHIWNKGMVHNLIQSQDHDYYSNPLSFQIAGTNEAGKSFSASTDISMGPGGNEIFIQREAAGEKNKFKYTRNASGNAYINTCEKYGDSFFSDESIIKRLVNTSIEEWQFVTLIPQFMGLPKLQKRTGGNIRLEKDGSNIADYLLDIRNIDNTAFDEILEALRYIMPYASDVQPALTSELERNVYLQMTEGNFKVPGWLLSTGTLRILALIALMRHPIPPPLICIEEIENGLDPRTIHLIVREIQNVVESGKSQIVVTTHSPYLLDLLTLSHIVLVERNENNEPVFSRPADQNSLKDWSKKFTPGKLYTMERLSSKRQK